MPAAKNKRDEGIIRAPAALKWAIDNCRVSEVARSGIECDTNRKNNPENIVQLAGQGPFERPLTKNAKGKGDFFRSSLLVRRVALLQKPRFNPDSVYAVTASGADDAQLQFGYALHVDAEPNRPELLPVDGCGLPQALAVAVHFKHSCAKDRAFTVVVNGHLSLEYSGLLVQAIAND